jgi:hypothetical protein
MNKTPNLNLILTHIIKYRNLYLTGVFALVLFLFFATNKRGIEIGEKPNPINEELERQSELIPDYEPGQSRVDSLEAYSKELANVASMLAYSEQVELLRMAESYRSLASVFILNPSMDSCYNQSVFTCLNSFWTGRIQELENKTLTRDLPVTESQENPLSFEVVNQNRARIAANHNVIFESKGLLIALILAKEPNARTESESLYLTREIPLYMDGTITANSITPEPLTTAQALSRLQQTQNVIGMSQGEISSIMECLRTGKTRDECASLGNENQANPVNY